MKVMLCEKATVEYAETLEEGWVAERKYDGVRAYIENGRLYDRREKDITEKFPEFVGLAELNVFIIDGEIVSQSGEFNDISGRVHLKDKFFIQLSAKKSPAIFMAFDIVAAGKQLWERKEVLSKLDVPAWMQKAEGGGFAELWEQVQQNGWEGVVLKRTAAQYQEGKRSADCLKIKAFVETTAVFTKLEQHNKGCRLETADGHSVNVNGAQASEVLRIFGKDGKVTCEVQYLPQNNSGAWRFPSFRKCIFG